MEPGRISADGLVLRPWRSTDVAAVTAACQDPLIPRWTDVPSPYRREHAREWIEEQCPAQYAAGTAAPLGAFDADSGDLLASCGFVALDRAAGEAEVGYWTVAAARGRGVAERAARALLGWGFGTLGLERVTWRAEVGNHASRLVALRLGFQLGGVDRAARGGDRRRDMWTAVLLPGELAAPAPDRPGAPGSAEARRAATFGGAQPTLAARTRDGTPFTLRPARDGDRDALAATFADPESAAWLQDSPLSPRVRAERTLAHAAQGWARGEAVTMIVADAADRCLGYLKFWQPASAYPDEMGCGYAVAPAARGRGYATAALRAGADWAMRHLALDRLEWYAYVGNDASRAVAARAGFREEGVSRFVDLGRRRDCWRAARLRTDGED
ncbi:hypothetical protein GCM10010124_05240 [Pilimelia terevasa]|uniref:N-acetyltransferase domain-containing protein n=1 Tax=Pilimelia terevasa TaxID=53372 RepID=A0A8J3BEG9_9ACTN|nr:GNAT family N-acetyltransferase [Pilimelia terevasa]GGK15457.1 hypothetical protein GCM10010124_05240 [Pilimelia terevasa]